MMRLALGAWWGRWGRPRSRPEVDARRSFDSSEPRAAVPMPVASRPKNWRRLIRSWRSVIGCIGRLLLRDRFVEVQSHVDQSRPRREFRRVQLRIALLLALRDQLLGGLGVPGVLAAQASDGAGEDLALGRLGRAGEQAEVDRVEPLVVGLQVL